ncbi:cyclic peptide export ABC transporter [Pseudomonas sp. GV071]|uniref:cyclic peptide export ABC transporter n=1 Tax=Pseudomonas sp. GV071 TaxID=2135754 RepID=UPI000D3D5BF8|nr:cyclic peptide export ABC transporter [Pseudomonas sp. GV071]PTQ68432.1 putative ATP-binding cassette transporter [Pseudomonas sp. GV071]
MTSPAPAAPSAIRELLTLLKPFWPLATLCIVLGVLGGLSITALLATINNGLHAQNGMSTGVVIAFAGFCVVALASSIAADIGTNYIGQHIIARLRKDLGAKVLSAPIEQIERFRSHRLIPVLTHDVDTVSDFAFAFAPLAISFTVTLGCLGYLAFLSWPMFLITAVAIVIGCTAQFFAQSLGLHGFHQAREAEDDLQKHYRAVAEGAKELRIHRPRRQRMFTQQLQATAERICRLQIRSISIFVTAKAFGSMLFFVVIALAIALQSLWFNNDVAVISGFVLVLLYMKGPLETLLATLPIVSRAQVAFSHIAELSRLFSSPEPHLLLADNADEPLPMQGIELREVAYAFPAVEGAQAFHLGPVNLKVAPGEILFIVGDNGSGKTTLIKLLLGLYPPQQGEVLLNGQAVTPEDRDDYRQLFTTIFADYYLFDDLVQGDQTLPADASKYLQRLELAHKVSVRDGAFTTTDLSTGQRKRLALVNAWLDGRPVLVFDEWAADQDPAFRKVFYTELLPDLKRLGKTIIVISHDDRYFDLADQVVHLHNGQLQAAPQPA